MSFRATLLIFGLVALSGCGFRPLYGNHAAGTASDAFLRVEIGSIADRQGQQLRNELVRRLYGGNQRLSALYRLETRLLESKTSLAVQKSAFATRANLVMSAQYRLLQLVDGEAVHSGSSRVTVSYNILDSEFASLLAEDNARKRAVRELSEDIRVRLGVFFDRLGSEKG